MAHVIGNDLAYAHPGGDLLFSGVSFRVSPGRKVGVVGANGIGKSTLFGVLTGALPADEGDVSIGGRLAHMRQDVGVAGDTRTVRELLLSMAPAALRSAGERMADAEHRLAAGDDAAGMDLATAIAWIPSARAPSACEAAQPCPAAAGAGIAATDGAGRRSLGTDATTRKEPAMATTASRPAARAGAVETVYVDRFCDGIIGPSAEVLGTVRDGGTIVANTTPGCWGPMITPAIQGGHEVTLPVNVEGAEVGDAIAIRIRSIDVTSVATSSGNDRMIEGRFNGDPYCAKVCASCGAEDEATVVEGIGEDAVRCAECGAPAAPFAFTNGYTIAFDDARRLGVTVSGQQAEAFAHDAAHAAALPANSIQNPILLFAPSDLVGVVARMRPFMGQLGTMPAIDLPDSHNAGDFGAFLVGAPHRHAVTAEQLAARSDGHLDIDAVRAGAILVCPVKLPGGGVYMGDMHAMQGDGEIAGHTADVAGTVTLQVSVIKGLGIDGPVLFPVEEDLPFLARPLTAQERADAEALAARYGGGAVEDSLPVSFVGSGPDLNSAVENGLGRAAAVLGMEVPEVMNRATISGAIEIGRAPGVVQVTFRAPVAALAARGLDGLAREQYGAPAA